MLETAPVTEATQDLEVADAGLEAVEEAELPDSYFVPYDPSDYTVAVGDILEISIFGHPDTMMESIPVAPDGNIYYLFTDAIKAEGRSINEIAADIESQVHHLFSSPEVTIIPRKMSAARYIILGKVNNPGEFDLNSSVTLRQAIGEAGGLSIAAQEGFTIPAAALTRSFIVRDGKKLPIDFEKLLNTHDDDQNIYIRPGDYIYVASALSQQVYRMGAVRNQRPVVFKDGMTLVGLLAGVNDPSGGIIPDAYTKEVLIVRGSLDRPEVSRVNFDKIIDGEANDVYLLPGDIVYVPPKRFLFLRAAVRLAIETFVRSFASRAGVYYAEDEWFN